MKKLTSLLTTLVLCLALSVVVLAQDPGNIGGGRGNIGGGTPGNIGGGNPDDPGNIGGGKGNIGGGMPVVLALLQALGLRL